MLKNYIKTAFRHFLRFKSYTFLNIAGLTVGLASSLLILLWVNDEVGMNKFHENGDRIYQVMRNMYQASGEIITTSGIPQPLEPVLENDYAEVDQVTLVSWEMDMLFQKDDRIFKEAGRYVSPEFLQIFTFPLIVGDAGTALNDIHSVVISDQLAVKYFGNDWQDKKIIGETVNIDERQEFVITGVFVKPGKNSSITFDWLLPAAEYIQRNEWVESWYNGGFSILFTVRDGADVAALGDKIEQEINENTNYAADERLFLQKYTDTYLYSSIENGIPAGGRIDYVRIFVIVAVFILIIACINFMNLATARSAKRTREIGIRKVMGARKGALGIQFLTESFLIALFSVILAVVVVQFTLPYFNDLTGKAMFLDFTSTQLWGFLLSITLITGLLSGSYPALLLPSFKITNAMKGTLKHTWVATIFRKGLVVFQFAISILLIIGTFVVYRQIQFIMNKNLGMNKENLVMIPMMNLSQERFNTYKNELSMIPEVVNVTSNIGNPLSFGRSTGSATWEGKDPDDVVEINVMSVSSDFIETMGMEIANGRDFSEEFVTDSSNYIINEVTADIMGFDDPVGQDLSVWGINGKIIGVVKNFHMNSMHEPIDPLIIRFAPPEGDFLAFVKIQGNTQDALLAIEKVTRGLNPAVSFNYSFLDEAYEQSYRSEIIIGILARIFSGIALFISCLGLFGLSSYAAEQRSREIGIRKVHGASVWQMIVMLGKDYTILILLAFILATPVAYYFMHDWLNNFVFRTTLSPILFIISGLAAFVIGAFTVSFKSYQAAILNPVNTLKDE